LKVLFVKGNSLFSKFICWALEEPVSHVALMFDKTFVVHSNLLGVNIDCVGHLRKSHQILFEVDVPVENEYDKLVQTVDLYEGKSYDYFALIYLGYRAILKKCFGLPFPLYNRLDSPDKFLCTEFVTSVIDHKTDSVISPYQLYLRLKG
jgi:hypothetical protein